MQPSISFRDYIRHLFVRSVLGLILLMLACFAGFGFFYYEVYIVRDTHSANEQIGTIVAAEWQRYNVGVRALARDAALQRALAGDAAEANRLLYDFSFAGPLRSDFALLRSDGTVVASNLYEVNRDLLEVHEGVQRDLARLRRMPDEPVSSVMPLPFSYDQAASYVFSAAVPNGDGGTAGYLLLILKTEAFRGLAAQSDADQVVITDAFDNVIFATNRLMEDSLGKFAADVQGEETVRIHDRPYYAAARLYGEGDVRVVTMTSIARQRQIAEAGAVFLLAVSALLLLAMPLLVQRVTGRSLSSISELLHAVRACRGGNIERQELPRSFCEFETLYEDFNAMLAEIRQLLATNAELAERKRLMEVRQLKGQFNPHFVFNVMEALRYVILIDPQRAAEMVVVFANLMRYSIRKSGASVELGTDIRYVEDYLTLQKMRYGDRLDYSIHVDAALCGCRVPKLLVQPIVENSIVHGLDRTRHLCLQIDGRREDADLCVTVEDDGPGMTDAKYAEICALLAAESAEPEHIGLYNVHRALRLLYGVPYGVEIVRQKSGIAVTLRMPLRWEDENV